MNHGADERQKVRETMIPGWWIARRQAQGASDEELLGMYDHNHAIAKQFAKGTLFNSAL